MMSLGLWGGGRYPTHCNNSLMKIFLLYKVKCQIISLEDMAYLFDPQGDIDKG